MEIQMLQVRLAFSLVIFALTIKQSQGIDDDSFTTVPRPKRNARIDDIDTDVVAAAHKIPTSAMKLSDLPDDVLRNKHFDYSFWHKVRQTSNEMFDLSNQLAPIMDPEEPRRKELELKCGDDVYEEFISKIVAGEPLYFFLDKTPELRNRKCLEAISEFSTLSGPLMIELVAGDYEVLEKTTAVWRYYQFQRYKLEFRLRTGFYNVATDKDIMTLAQSLYHKQDMYIDVKIKNISQKVGDHLEYALKKSTHLRALELTSAAFADSTSLQPFFSGLSQASGLEQLTISNFVLTRAITKLLVSVLEKHRETLTILRFSTSDFGDVESRHDVEEAISKLSNLSKLKLSAPMKVDFKRLQNVKEIIYQGTYEEDNASFLISALRLKHINHINVQRVAVSPEAWIAVFEAVKLSAINLLVLGDPYASRATSSNLDRPGVMEAFISMLKESRHLKYVHVGGKWSDRQLRLLARSLKKSNGDVSFPSFGIDFFENSKAAQRYLEVAAGKRGILLNY